MLYALDDRGERLEPAPDRCGICGLCKLPLVAKCGKINVWHWSHRAGDCDTWNEGETDWHRGWKLRAEASWREAMLPPHRADLRRPDGLVIELQRSPISAVDIAARENFYGEMWWLFHRERLGKNARIFRVDEERVHMRWLNGSRTLPLVKKPMYVDLGGPIIEFTERLTGTGGRGNLLSRRAFLEKAGLFSLSEEELASHSHDEIHWSSASGISGVIAPSAKHLVQWRDESRKPGGLRSVRHDGTYEVKFGK